MSVISRNETTFNLLVNGTINATGAVGSVSSGVCNVGAFDKVLVYLGVGGVSGTLPTLDAKVQSSADATNWYDLTGGAFTQITAAATPAPISLTAVGKYIRVMATVGGSASPTFTGVTLQAHAKG